MSIKETLMADMKTAMKAKDTDRLAAIRFLQAAVKNKEIEVRPNELTDKDAMDVVKKMVKQLKDAITQYEDAGRTDLADKEKAQLKVVEVYMPAQMSKEQLEKLIDDVIKETSASSMKDMGTVIKATMDKAGGAADGKMVSQIVKERLS